jgi:hypothetical protein
MNKKGLRFVLAISVLPNILHPVVGARVPVADDIRRPEVQQHWGGEGV